MGSIAAFQAVDLDSFPGHRIITFIPFITKGIAERISTSKADILNYVTKKTVVYIRPK